VVSGPSKLWVNKWPSHGGQASGKKQEGFLASLGITRGKVHDS